MTEKQPPDPLTATLEAAAKPSDQDRIRLAQMRLASEHQRQEARKRILAATELRNKRKQREITDTEQDRRRRLEEQEKQKRNPAPVRVPDHVAGWHGKAKPLTNADKAEITRKVSAQLRVDNAEMGRKIDAQVDARLANQLEAIADPERVKVDRSFKQARSEKIAQWTRATGRDKSRDRELGD